MYPMNYGSPYGPSMQNAEGTGMPHLGLLQRMHMGGAMPPMAYPQMHTGGPMQQSPNTGIVPPNILTGGAYPAQQAMGVRTGGAMQPQPMPQNRLGGIGGGYNFGLGGLLR